MDRFAFSDPLVRNTIYSGINRQSSGAAAPPRRRDARTATARTKRSGAPSARATSSRHFPSATSASPRRRPGRPGTRRPSASRTPTRSAGTGGRPSSATEAGWSHRQIGRDVLELGAALDQSGQRNEARATYLEAAEHARAVDDGALLADAAIGSTPRYVTVYDFQPSQRALVDEALEHVGSDGRRLAWLLCCASAVATTRSRATSRTRCARSPWPGSPTTPRSGHGAAHVPPLVDPRPSGPRGAPRVQPGAPLDLPDRAAR